MKQWVMLAGGAGAAVVGSIALKRRRFVNDQKAGARGVGYIPAVATDPSLLTMAAVQGGMAEQIGEPSMPSDAGPDPMAKGEPGEFDPPPVYGDPYTGETSSYQRGGDDPRPAPASRGAEARTLTPYRGPWPSRPAPVEHAASSRYLQAQSQPSRPGGGRG